MKKESEWARRQFASSPVARLATAAYGQPHIVVIVFAVIDDTIYSAIDDKPKSGRPLRRLHNIAHNDAVSVLADHYAEDWTQLWWARADGRARLVESTDAEASTALAALAERYPHYRQVTPTGPVIAIDVRRWSGWTYA